MGGREQGGDPERSPGGQVWWYGQKDRTGPQGVRVDPEGSQRKDEWCERGGSPPLPGVFKDDRVITR